MVIPFYEPACGPQLDDSASLQGERFLARDRAHGRCPKIGLACDFDAYKHTP